MFDKKLKNILAVLLLVLFVVSLTASAVNASSTSKSVSLYYLQLAATSDPARPQGGTTPGAVDSVKIVEAALVKADSSLITLMQRMEVMEPRLSKHTRNGRSFLVQRRSIVTGYQERKT